jgi:hypothetical protein
VQFIIEKNILFLLKKHIGSKSKSGGIGKKILSIKAINPSNG